MAAPLSADRLVRALKDEGVRVVEYRDWRENNRNHVGAWGPVHGVMLHHTVTTGTDATVELCYEGRSDLPGPLCHGVIAKDGTVYLVGHGRANHAGSGDGDVLAAVIDERDLPPDNDTDTDGNIHFYGYECVNLGDGEDPWPPEQVEAAVRVSAALCRAHGWGTNGDTSVIGHAEWQPGKIDPHGPGISMANVRRRVAERLTHPPTWSPGDPEEDTDMPAFTGLGTAEDILLTRGTWTRIFWDQEWRDEPGHHARGGSVFARGPAVVEGTASLHVAGLVAGAQVQARIVEIADDEVVHHHPIAEATATAGDTHLVLPFTNHLGAGRGAAVQVVYHAGHDQATLTDCYLKALIWPR